MRYQFIKAEKAKYSVIILCRVMQVSRSGYYAWDHRPLSKRDEENQNLLEKIEGIYLESRGTYGSPRIHDALKQGGMDISRHRVAWLMRKHGIRSCYGKKRRFPKTTDSHHGYPIAPNRIEQHFCVDAPNQVWVNDITYIPTAEGWLYLAVILDLYARNIVGWAMESHLSHTLATQSLTMAIQKREVIPNGIIHHSDRGVQYAAEEFQKALSKNKILCSMSAKGNCLDNAVAESFFKTLKVELIHRSHFQTRKEAKTAIFEYMEVFYNQKRLHSYLGYKTPAEYESAYFAKLQTTVH